jgi:hypothetical protein
MLPNVRTRTHLHASQGTLTGERWWWPGGDEAVKLRRPTSLG